MGDWNYISHVFSHNVTSTTAADSCRPQLVCFWTFNGMKAPSHSRWIRWRWCHPACCSSFIRNRPCRHEKSNWQVLKLSVSSSGTQLSLRALLSCFTCTVLTRCPQSVLSCQSCLYLASEALRLARPCFLLGASRSNKVYFGVTPNTIIDFNYEIYCFCLSVFLHTYLQVKTITIHKKKGKWYLWVNTWLVGF